VADGRRAGTNQHSIGLRSDTYTAQACSVLGGGGLCNATNSRWTVLPPAWAFRCETVRWVGRRLAQGGCERALDHLAGGISDARWLGARGCRRSFECRGSDVAASSRSSAPNGPNRPRVQRQQRDRVVSHCLGYRL